jgi:hypothetical protein
MGAFLGLARIARRYEVTKRELLEDLIKIEDDATLELATPEWDEYFVA